MTVTTTDADTIRTALAQKIETIVPRYAAQQDRRWVWMQDQEIRGTLRSFDVILDPQIETPGGAYGGGIQYETVTRIVASYPLSEPDMRRFVGADGEDLSAILIRIHTDIPGVLANHTPLELSVEGEGGAYVATFTTVTPFFASDTVTTEVVA